MKSLKKDTLAFQLGVRPGTQRVDMRAVPCQSVSSRINKFSEVAAPINSLPFWEGSSEGSPERDAIMFYMFNHAVSIVRQRVHPYAPLGRYTALVLEYQTQLALRVTRMFYYMVLICVRESRHEKSPMSSAYWGEMKAKHHVACMGLHASIKGTSSSIAQEAFRQTPPDCTIGELTTFLSDVFRTGKWSSGFGGKAWAAVADVLRDFVHGTITAEMMMDTAFTLCHNNGPIFNKGMLFTEYSSEIYRILDVQRSGQIPQFIGNCESKWSTDHIVAAAYKFCKSILPDEFSGQVDWHQVEALGALHSYPNEKKAMKLVDFKAKVLGVELTPSSAWPVNSPSTEVLKQADTYAEMLSSQAVTNKYGLEVLPGVWVKHTEEDREE